MAMQTIGVVEWPYLMRHQSLNALAVNGASQTMTAVGHYVAVVWKAREAMTVSHFGARTGPLTGTCTADFRIETVDTTTGQPTGTLMAASGNVVSGTLTASAWTLQQLANPVSISRGTDFAAVIRYATGTSLTITTNAFNTGIEFPYRVTSTGTPAKGGTHMNMVLGSSSTAFYYNPLMWPIAEGASVTFNSTNSVARGLRFKVPFKCRCCGITLYQGTASGDFNAVIYDDAGSELGNSSTSFDGNVIGGGTNVHNRFYLDNPVTLSPATWYRATIEPTTATNTAVFTLTMPSANHISASSFNANAHYTVRTSGVWDDSQTSVIPMLGILIDQLDDGAVTGGGGASTVIGS